MKNWIILIFSLILTFSAYGFGFKFHLFPNNKIINYGSYRAWNDGYAKSCNDYKFPIGRNYVGDIGSGIYKIKPTAAPVAFNVYCDMTTSGGGWTLLFSNSMAPYPTAGTYPPDNAIYKGDSTINTNFTYNGYTVNSQDMQNAVKYVEGQYLNILGYVNKSSTISSFKTKLNLLTPWISSYSSSEVSGLTACISSSGYTPAWNYSYSGGNTSMYFLAGCHMAESYGDRQGSGISAIANPTGSSCGPGSPTGACGYYYIVGHPMHRGISVNNAQTSWIK